MLQAGNGSVGARTRPIAARAACAAALLAGAAAGGAQPPVPDFLGSAAPPVRFAGYRRETAYAPVRDGTRLAVTIYRPSGGADPQRFPTLFWFHPGHRESIDPKTGAIRPTMAAADIAFFTGQGYAVAVGEMRGSGASFGSRELDRGPQIGRDGKDLVDWIAGQPWSDGRVGMIGASYQGFAQYATAAERPKALKAIFPEIAGFDDYTSMFFPGGILLAALSESASASIQNDDLNRYLPDGRRPHLPSAPVIDEDGDGELADEIPLDRNGNGDFLDDGPPTYADGKPRQHVYYSATREHRANRNLTVPKLAAAPFRDSRIDGTPHRWLDLDPGVKPAQLAGSGIAVYNRGGWFDYHARDTVMWHATLAGKTPTRLLMAPVGHGGLPAGGGDSLYRSGPYLAAFGDTRSTNEAMKREKLAFFDRYVKGLANGFERRPPVLLYVMGRGWRYEDAWPLARARQVRFAFDRNGLLSAATPAGGVDRYRADLAASSLSEGANRWNYGISTARKPMTLDGRGRRLLYQTMPLDAEMEVTGHPLVDLVLSSDADEGDVFAYLEDVAPDGSSRLVTEGQLRANFHRLRGGGPSPEARPALPWQGFARADHVARPFAGGRRLRLRFDLMPTAWVFPKGHRIRVSLAAADWPSFHLHPALSPANDPGAADTRVPTWNVHRGPGLSAVTLPVVPASRR